MIPQGQQSDGGDRHERRDADVIALLLIVGLLLLLLGLSFLVCWGVLKMFDRAHEAQQPPPRAPAEAKPFPAPRLLVQPGQEWAKTRSYAEQRLETYGWVDREAGVAHIPVTRSMALLVEKGLPEVGAGQTRLQLLQGRAQTGAQPNEQRTDATPEASP